MMAALTKKIDFIGFIMVERSNPNGDPLNGNQPRTDYGGYGEISDVFSPTNALMTDVTASVRALRQILRWINR